MRRRCRSGSRCWCRTSGRLLCWSCSRFLCGTRHVGVVGLVLLRASGCSVVHWRRALVIGRRLTGALIVSCGLTGVALTTVALRTSRGGGIGGVSVEGRGAGSSSYCWASVVLSGELRAVLSREVLVLHLLAGWLDVVFVHRCNLFRTGAGFDAAVAAVEADVVVVHDGVVNDNVAVDVNVAEVASAKVDYGAVVEEVAAAPFAAGEADAAVAEAVVDAAVEADVRAPIAVIEAVVAALPAPVGGCPEEANGGGFYPDAGDPVVAAVVGVSPVAGGPDIAVAGAEGLRIDGKRGRCEAYGDH